MNGPKRITWPFFTAIKHTTAGYDLILERTFDYSNFLVEENVISDP